MVLGYGLYFVTKKPPSAANKIPAINCQRIAPKPLGGGCSANATMAFTIGAPAKTIDMTTVGVPLAPKASNTQKAPNAPTTPASNDQPMPFAGMLHVAPFAINIRAGPTTAVIKYAMPTKRKALYLPFTGSLIPIWPECRKIP